MSAMQTKFKQAVWASALAAMIVLVAYLWISSFLAQDACLDNGGAWKNGSCQH
jgi:hypothetical protein